jgi:opacity protein-like surface antigen
MEAGDRDAEPPDSEPISFGLALFHTPRQGLSGRIMYHFRPGAEVIYDESGDGHTGFPDPRTCGSRVRFRLHQASASAVHFLNVYNTHVRLFAGGGVSAAVIDYPEPDEDKHKKDWIYGFSVFPSIGVEFEITERVSLQAEYEYHIGRSLKDKCAGRYSLNGPFILFGLSVCVDR